MADATDPDPPAAHLYTGEGEIPRDAEEVEVHPSVTEIPDRLFASRHRLRSLILHRGLLRIGWRAFARCTSLRSFRCPSTVTKIGEYAFWGCSRLAEVVLPDGLDEIEAGTFRRCTSLEEIRIPATVARIGRGAFCGCRNLALLKLREGLRGIERGAFEDCSSLESLLLPSSVEDVEEEAFRNCSSLSVVRALEEARIPATVARIGRGAFAGCTNLRLIELREGLRWIEWAAFQGCSSLESLRLPSSVEEVGEEAFMNCRNLRSVRLHEDLPRIGRYAFEGCASLERFRFARLSERMEAVSMDDRTRSVFVDRLSEITLALTGEEEDDSDEDDEEAEEEAEEEPEALRERCKMSLGRAHEVLNYWELKGAAPVLELALWKAKIEGEGRGGGRGERITDEERGQDLSNVARKKKKLKVVKEVGQNSRLSRTDCRVKCGAGILFTEVLKFFAYRRSWPRLND